MTTPDLTNACFELLGAVLQWANVARLLRDRRVAGVDWRVTAFHVAWGAWNIYFYSFVTAPLSALAAGFLAIANLVWIYFAIKYTRMNRADR